MDNKNLTIQEFIKKCGGNPWDVCTYFYSYYIKDKDNGEALDNLIIFLNSEESSDDSIAIEEFHPKEQYESALNEVFKFMGNVVNNLVTANPDEREFYLSLLEKINDDTIFETDIKKSLAIMSLKTSVKIPYYKLDEGLKLGEDDYRKLIDDNLTAVRKSLFIVNSGLEQNTEVASLLLNLIKEQKSDKVKAVILANVLSFFNYRYQKLYLSFIEERKKNSGKVDN